MRPLVLRNLWANKRRLLSTALATVVGVAFLAGTLVIGDTGRAGFDSLFRSANSGVDAVVRNPTRIGSEMAMQRGLVPADLAPTIGQLDEVAGAQPSIEGLAQILGADGERIGTFGPPNLAGNWLDNPDLGAYRLAEGRAPEADDEVVIDRGSAEAGDLAVGDTTIVLTPDPVEVTVVGLVTFGDVDSLGGTTWVGFTTAAAGRHLLGGDDQATTIAVAAAEGVSQDELVIALDRLLDQETGGTVEAISGTDLSSEQTADIEADFLQFFEIFLTLFAVIALLVAMFSIHNTFAILVAQRDRESALLRALGARRAQVLAATGAEALVVGIVASSIAVVAGIGLAAAALAGMDAAGFGIPGAGLRVEADAIAVAWGVGVTVTVGASLAPAVRASRIAPLEAMRAADVEQERHLGLRTALGAAVEIAGLGLVIGGAVAGAAGPAALGALAVIVGAIVLGPVLAGPVARVLGAPAAAGGMAGALARRNAMRNRRRTAATATALTVGVGVVTLFTVVGASLSATIGEGIGDHVRAELAMAANPIGGVGIGPEVAPALEERPEIGTAAGIALGTVIVGDGNEPVSVADPGRLATVLDLGIVDGSVDEVGPAALAVSEPFADDHGLAAGDDLTVAFADGTSETLVVGMIYTTRDIIGNLVLRPDTWVDHVEQRFDLTVLATVAEGSDQATAQAAAQEVADRFHAPDVVDRGTYLDDQTAMIDQALGIVYGLLAVAILIALMGIANTLTLSVHERTREIGLLRAVGQTRRQVRAMVLWESVVVAGYGTVVGLVIGVVVGWGLLEAVAGSLDLDTVFAAPLGSLAAVVVAGAVVGVVAALRPARRAARLDILDAIAAT